MIVFNEDEDKEGESTAYFVQIIQITVLSVLFFVVFGLFFPKDISQVSINKLKIVKKEKIEDKKEEKAVEIATDEYCDSAAMMFYDFLEESLEEKKNAYIYESVQSETHRNPGALDGFFAKLYELETTGHGNIRIAYYGDSMIEGDYIIQTLRSLFQKRYGGAGVGIVPVSLPNPSYRNTIKHNFSKNFRYESVIKRGGNALGAAACASFAAQGDTSWATYKSGTNRIINPTIMYGKSDNTGAKIIASGEDFFKEYNLYPNKYLNFLNIDTDADSIGIEFIDAHEIAFFGVNFSGKTGVYIDNFSIRGSSGLALIHLQKEVMNAFQRSFDYDLIILQFGANVLRQDVKSYKWYREKMVGVVEHLRQCFYGADVLIISAADKAAKYGAEIRTDSLIYSLLKSQRECADITNSGFLNLFQIMGGEGTMARWVSMEPALGSKDMVHFSYSGSSVIANAIYEKLDKQYIDYKKNIEKGIR
jgi:lysophospholipase L1-like esterase